MGVGTGWTVSFKQKPCLNSIRCGNILFKRTPLLSSKYSSFFGPSAFNFLFFFFENPHGSNKAFHQRLHIERNSVFYQWLVGFTDGDGTFAISYKNNKLSFIYKISLGVCNARAIAFIKQKIGIGSVRVDEQRDIISFVIRDKTIFTNLLFPIFDKYPLLTTKYFYYSRLKDVYNTSNDLTLTKEEKHSLIMEHLNRSPGDNYLSPAWNKEIKTSLDAKDIMSKPWLVGFIEAEASFSIVSKEKNRLCHGFGLTQKLDKIVLESIRLILHIKSKVRNRSSFYSLDATGKRDISNIANYFEKTLKSVKSLQFKIWKNTLIKNENLSNIEKQQNLLKTQSFMRKLRKKRPTNLIKQISKV